MPDSRSVWFPEFLTEQLDARIILRRAGRDSLMGVVGVELPALPDPDLVTVAVRVPKAVFTLISALHFHGITTEIPHAVSIALPRGTATPHLDWPPLDVHWFSGRNLTYGIETHDRDGVALRIYSPAKTVADCFRFRNKIGTDVALEALKATLEEGKATPADIVRAAEVCTIDRVMRPSLEALL